MRALKTITPSPSRARKSDIAPPSKHLRRVLNLEVMEVLEVIFPPSRIAFGSDFQRKALKTLEKALSRRIERLDRFVPVMFLFAPLYCKPTRALQRVLTSKVSKVSKVISPQRRMIFGSDFQRKALETLTKALSRRIERLDRFVPVMFLFAPLHRLAMRDGLRVPARKVETRSLVTACIKQAPYHEPIRATAW